MDTLQYVCMYECIYVCILNLTLTVCLYVYVCVCVCVCVFIYLCTYLYKTQSMKTKIHILRNQSSQYIHKYIHTYIHTYIRTSLRALSVLPWASVLRPRFRPPYARYLQTSFHWRDPVFKIWMQLYCRVCMYVCMYVWLTSSCSFRSRCLWLRCHSS